MNLNRETVKNILEVELNKQFVGKKHYDGREISNIKVSLDEYHYVTTWGGGDGDELIIYVTTLSPKGRNKKTQRITL